MIYLVGTRHYDQVMKSFFNDFGGGFESWGQFLPLESLPRIGRLPTGTYLFLGLDLFTPAQRRVGTWLADTLEGDPRNRVLNHPRRFLGRFDLLRQLHDRGANAFNVYRMHEAREIKRWPVFVRFESNHDGPQTPLIETAQDLEHVLLEAAVAGVPESELMICEFLDVSEDGLYRKYGAYNFAGDFVPRSLVFSDDWVTKAPSQDRGGEARPEWLAEQDAFLADFPHRDQVAEVFRLAGIDYGRIDYGVKDGQSQVWEINTNPIPALPPHRALPARQAGNRRFADRLIAEFQRLAEPNEEGFVELNLPDALLYGRPASGQMEVRPFA